MPKIFNLGSHNPTSNDNCIPANPITAPLKENQFKACEPNAQDLCDAVGMNKQLGFEVTEDHLKSGQIYNDPANPTRDVIYRYAKGIRGTDDAMQDMFRKIVVIDDDAKIWPVPLMWGTQEKAVSYVTNQNARKDNTLVVDRPTLPLLAIHQTGISPNPQRYVFHKAREYFRDEQGHPGFAFKEGANGKDKGTIFGFSKGIPIDISYTLYALTKYLEDMNQIAEQILTKFSLLAYIKVKGIPWEIPVKLDGIGNNINFEVGDKAERVIKYQFNLVVETYIPQPITRVRSVLNIKTDFYNSADKKNIEEVYIRTNVEAKDKND
jgi:hypothetical protein